MAPRTKIVATHAGLILFCAVILLPLLWVLRTSLVPETMAYAPALLPALTWDNYAALLAGGTFPRALGNSLTAAGVSTLLALPFAAGAGYAFARYGFGGALGRFAMLATQMLPPVALVLPTFALFRVVGLTNSLPGLILVYAGLNLPFMTWILMGFFEGVPEDIEAAARIDGGTAWGAFRHVVLPLSLPGIATAATLGFILAWNEFLFALVLSGPGTATLPVMLAGLQSSNGVRIAQVAAAVVLAVLPMAVLSRFVQRFLVRGLTYGGVK